MASLPVSVVVVSRGRPGLLTRCLTGIGQLWYDAFEIVVVADGPGCGAVRAMGWGDRVKLAQCDEANISVARNRGIALAAGQVVAFVDDDAVPEPTWLTHLIAPFDDPDVAQTGGFVRGRNGLGFQWRARAVDALGTARELPVPGTAPFTPEVAPGEVIKTEGTNMAVRRSDLAAVGGFDPAFRFFLDETDLNRRLAHRRSVIVPLAQVHHGYAASDTRAAHRGARDLTEIGASTAVFLRKHAPDQIELGRDRAFFEQESRLMAQMIAGTIGPEEVRPCLDSFTRGFEAGLLRSMDPQGPIGPCHDEFLRCAPTAPGPSRFVAGRTWQRRRIAAAARAAVAQGSVTTALRLSPTALAHRVRFHPDGYWEQWGGLFGRVERTEPWFKWASFAAKLRKQEARVAKLRKN